MLDVGLLATGLAVGVAAAVGRGQIAVRAALAAHWLAIVFFVSLSIDKATTVFILTAADFGTAFVAVLIAGHRHGYWRTRAVGFLALLAMPLHMVQSASTGNLNWHLYAASLNALFVLQCLIATGFCDGMGRRLATLYAWFYDPAFSRDGSE